MNGKVSIIIPVYQTEKYLSQCVDSVLNQTYTNIEVLLIDDGSKDNSPALCDEYAKKDNRIVVIHQENGGLSKARNRGIEKAVGKYVLFVDSDDYWDDTGLLQKLADMMDKKPVDIINFRYKFYMESSQKYQACLPSVQREIIGESKDSILNVLLEKGLYIASACNKMLDLEYLRRNELYFQEGITAEDVNWCARILVTCKNMGYCDTDAYVYRQREGSITHTVKYENIVQITKNIEYCMNLGKDLKENTEFYNLYYTYVAYQYGVFQISNHYVKDKRIKELRKEMKPYRWLLRFRNNPKIKMLYFLDKYIGYAGMNFAMGIYAKVR